MSAPTRKGPTGPPEGHWTDQLVTRLAKGIEDRKYTLRELADMSGISYRTVKRGRHVIRYGSPALVIAVKDGHIGLRTAERIARPETSHELQDAAVDALKNGAPINRVLGPEIRAHGPTPEQLGDAVEILRSQVRELGAEPRA